MGTKKQDLRMERAEALEKAAAAILEAIEAYNERHPFDTSGPIAAKAFDGGYKSGMFSALDIVRGHAEAERSQ